MFVALLLLIHGAPAQAVELITGDEYAPWVDGQLPGEGIAVELVREVFELVSTELVSVDVKPWSRALYETQQDLYDATFPFVRTPERDQIFLFSAPLFTVRNVLFSHISAPAFRDIDNLKGKTLWILH
ncbi:substrate-binding periplasmic protein [Allohahella marinimesophila]|uniref:Solute-binding protein family 3/N-terminal domain-containing protein n=1 Tax=Allohahella marinimesophila TaxID=1054972 RepID=A0ABP7NG64_9GAMM